MIKARRISERFSLRLELLWPALKPRALVPALSPLEVARTPCSPP